MKNKITLSRHSFFKSRQTQHEFEVNSIVTKTAIVVTEVMKNYEKLMLRHSKENKAEISVATKEDYVATIKIAE